MKRIAILGDERGAVLITGLVMLLLLTLMGVVSMQTTTLEEKMAGNLEQQDLAFQAAEAGLRDAEEWLDNTVVLPAFNGAGGLFQAAAMGETPVWETVNWKAEVNGNFLTYRDADLDGVFKQANRPRYIIEFMTEVVLDSSDSLKVAPDPDDKQGSYRITSRGISPNTRGEVILQTTFIR